MFGYTARFLFVIVVLDRRRRYTARRIAWDDGGDDDVTLSREVKTGTENPADFRVRIIHITPPRRSIAGRDRVVYAGISFSGLPWLRTDECAGQGWTWIFRSRNTHVARSLVGKGEKKRRVKISFRRLASAIEVEAAPTDEIGSESEDLCTTPGRRRVRETGAFSRIICEIRSSGGSVKHVQRELFVQEKRFVKKCFFLYYDRAKITIITVVGESF